MKTTYCTNRGIVMIEKTLIIPKYQIITWGQTPINLLILAMPTELLTEFPYINAVTKIGAKDFLLCILLQFFPIKN